MRAILIASLFAFALGFCMASASMAAELNATPIVRLPQGDDSFGWYYDGYRPACPELYYFTCWADPYGRNHCGCRPGFAYYYFRFN
jgi:hypothetical protein